MTVFILIITVTVAVDNICRLSMRSMKEITKVSLRKISHSPTLPETSANTQAKIFQSPTSAAQLLSSLAQCTFCPKSSTHFSPLENHMPSKPNESQVLTCSSISILIRSAKRALDSESCLPRSCWSSLAYSSSSSW